MDHLKKELTSRNYKLRENKGKLFVNNSVIIEISILGRNSIIICDTIFIGIKYTTFLISLKNRNFPKSLLESLIKYITMYEAK